MKISVSDDRREDQGAGRLAGQDALPAPRLDQASRLKVVEEWKWRGIPVWSHGGLICTGETDKNVLKMTFAKGAALDDPSGVFNSSLDGNNRRAIDFHEGEEIDEEVLNSYSRGRDAERVPRPRLIVPGEGQVHQRRRFPSVSVLDAVRGAKYELEVADACVFPASIQNWALAATTRRVAYGHVGPRLGRGRMRRRRGRLFNSICMSSCPK